MGLKLKMTYQVRLCFELTASRETHESVLSGETYFERFLASKLLSPTRENPLS